MRHAAILLLVASTALGQNKAVEAKNGMVVAVSPPGADVGPRRPASRAATPSMRPSRRPSRWR